MDIQKSGWSLIISLLLFNFRVNIDKLTFDFNIYLPKLSFRGKYDLKIRLLLLNIAGVGDLKGVLGKWFSLLRLCNNSSLT